MEEEQLQGPQGPGEDSGLWGRRVRPSWREGPGPGSPPSPTHRPHSASLTPAPHQTCTPRITEVHSLLLHFYLTPWDSGQRRNLESPCFLLLAVPHTSQVYHHFPTPSRYKYPPPPPSLSVEFKHLSRVTEVSSSRKPSQTPTSTGISPSMNAPALAYLGSHTCVRMDTHAALHQCLLQAHPASLCTRAMVLSHTGPL